MNVSKFFTWFYPKSILRCMDAVVQNNPGAATKKDHSVEVNQRPMGLIPEREIARHVQALDARLYGPSWSAENIHDLHTLTVQRDGVVLAYLCYRKIPEMEYLVSISRVGVHPDYVDEDPLAQLIARCISSVTQCDSISAIVPNEFHFILSFESLGFVPETGFHVNEYGTHYDGLNYEYVFES